VADGGVPLSRLDRDKLSEWWLLHLDTKFDHEKEENKWICQFCVWDARLVIFISRFVWKLIPPFRFERENSEDVEKKSSCIWWSDEKDPFYKFYSGKNKFHV